MTTNNNSYIFNEQAVGNLDWVNVVFTVVNPIATIESLRIGYIEYTDFTYSWDTITLADAPSSINGGVFVDYFYDTTSDTFSPVNLIYDEELIWEVDWINKLFYSIYPIDKIDELRVGNIAYSNFTVNWRAITLSSAPSVLLWAPRIDYYRKDATINIIDSWVTLSELRSSIYIRIGQTVTSLQYPKELADEYISEWVNRIGKMKQDRKKRWILSFHKAYDWTIRWISWTSIDVGTTSKYLPTKGIAIVGTWDVVYYESKTSSSITSISDLELNNLEWDKIQYGYRLPRNINKVSEVFIWWFKLTPADFSEYRAQKENDKFCEYNWYLFVPYRTTDADVVTVVYIWKHESTYSDSDIIDFNWDYLPVIKTFVLWNMYHDREDDRSDKEEKRYEKVLREYKRELSKQYETTAPIIQTSWPLNKI